jgi:anti-sigma factor RsiW
MSCDWTAKLDRYVDGELSAGEVTEFQEHLAGCAGCAAGALSRLQLKRMTHAAGQRFRPRANLREKIEKSISARPGPSWFRRWVPALAVAAALVLMLASTAIWLRHARGEQAVGELADLHVATLASTNPVDVISTDRHTVKPWFQGKVPFTFNLPELQDSPFKLIGGSVAYFQQSPGAHLLFELRKHRISVFIFQNRGEAGWPNPGSRSPGDLTFSSETWTNGGLRYFVIGDCNRSDLHDLRKLFESAAGH